MIINELVDTREEGEKKMEVKAIELIALLIAVMIGFIAGYIANNKK